MKAQLETINIHLTRSCNFSCSYCYAGWLQPRLKKATDRHWWVCETLRGT